MRNYINNDEQLLLWCWALTGATLENSFGVARLLLRDKCCFHEFQYIPHNDAHFITKIKIMKAAQIVLYLDAIYNNKKINLSKAYRLFSNGYVMKKY